MQNLTEKKVQEEFSTSENYVLWVMMTISYHESIEITMLKKCYAI